MNFAPRKSTSASISPGANKLVADPGRLVEALRQVVATCVERGNAEAVIIGGGLLGNAATALTPMFSVPVIAPIPAAVHRVLGLVRKCAFASDGGTYRPPAFPPVEPLPPVAMPPRQAPR